MAALLYQPDYTRAESTAEGRLISLAVHASVAVSMAEPHHDATPAERKRMAAIAIQYLSAKCAELYPNLSQCTDDVIQLTQLHALVCPALHKESEVVDA